MEIKKGDKVRIANNAPSEYRYGFNCRLRTQESEVVGLDDDGYMAAIVPMCVNDKDLWFQIPTKYLVKVDAQADANEPLQEEYMRFMKDCMSCEVYTQSDFLKDYDPSKHEVNPEPRYIPKIMFNTEFWVKYEAELAKELAISYAKRGKSPLDAVAAAKEIVKRLKQK